MHSKFAVYYSPRPTCRRDIQQEVFATIGLSEEEARGKFGYLMDSFELGAPPHGGELCLNPAHVPYTLPARVFTKLRACDP